MNNLFKLNKNNYVKQIMLLAALVILLTATVRFSNQGFSQIGQESYYHQRMTRNVMEQGFFYSTPIDNEFYILNPFHVILALVSFIFGINVIANFLPILINLGIVWFFIKLLEWIDLEPKEIFYTCVLFILSPIFVHNSITLSVYPFVLLMGLCGWYFRKNQLLSNTFYLLGALSSLLGGLALAGLLGIQYLYKKNRRVLNSFLLILVATILTRQYPVLITKTTNVFTLLIGGLGGLKGFNIYFVVLALIGTVITWKYKMKLATTYTYITLFLIISIFSDTSLNIFILGPLSILAMFGLLHIMNRDWEVDYIKDLTLIILITGVIFSSISYLELNKNAEPNQNVVESLLTLRLYSDGEGKVLSYYDKAEWIKSLSGLKVYSDLNKIHEQELNNLFYSRSFENIINFLELNDINYIWIDNEMKERFWPVREYGLIYFLQSEEYFEVIYESEGATLWKFIKKPYSEI